MKKLIYIFILMLLITLTSALSLDPNAVSYYNFEEGSGTTLIDQWGSNDGTINGMTWSSSVPTFNISGDGESYSGSFDGSNDLVNTNYQIPDDEDFSINMWISPNSLNIDNYFLTDIISTSNRDGIQLGIEDSDNKLRVVGFTSNSASVNSSIGSTFNTNIYNMITLVYDDTAENLEIFQNKTSILNLSWARTGSDTFLFFGRQYTSVSTNSFDGLIDEIKIFNKSLTSDEVENLYNYGTIESQSPDRTTFLNVKEIDFDNFNFSSDTFQTFGTIQINLTNATNLINDFVFDFEKITGSGDSDIYIRSIVNGVPKASSVLTTISGNSNNKENVKISNTGLLPAGINNISYQIRRTGTGIITASNVRKILIKDKATNDLSLDLFKNSIDSSCSASGTWATCGVANYTSRFNQTIFGINTGRLNNSGDVYHLKLNESPVTSLTIDDAGDFASASHNWVYNVDDENGTFNIYQYSDGVSSFDIIGSVIFLGLSTNESVSIPYYNKTGSSTDTSSVGYGIGEREVLNLPFNVTNTNNDFYLTFNGHLQNNIGVVGTATWEMYIDDGDCLITSRTTHSNDNIESVALVQVCENLSSGSHTAYINLTTTSSSSWSYYDDMIVAIEGQEFDVTSVPDTTPPVVNWSFPDYPDWTNLTINGTCSDDGVISSVSIDSMLFSLTSSDPRNWEFTYIGAGSLNSTTLNVSCVDNSDNTGYATQVLGVDVSAPVCVGIANQNLESGDNYSWNVNCSDDLNLYSVNVTCVGGTDYSFFLDNINDVSYNFINNTGSLTSSMVCDWTLTDAHTIKDITDKVNSVNTFYYDDALTIDGFKYIEFDSGDSDNIDSLTLDFASKKDRVKFKVIPDETKNSKELGVKGSESFDKNKLKENKLTFYVNAKNKLHYIDNDKFPAWFVIDDYYWVDFDVLNGYDLDYQIHKINDTRYRVIVKGKVENFFDFNSLGIVNTNTYSQTFTITQPSLDFGVICGEKYPSTNLTLNFSDNNLVNCNLRVNDMLYYSAGTCDEYNLEGFYGRNNIVLSGYDADGVLQSDSCDVFLNKTNKSSGDFFDLIVFVILIMLFFIIGRTYILFSYINCFVVIFFGLYLIAFDSIIGSVVMIAGFVLFLLEVLNSR